MSFRVFSLNSCLAFAILALAGHAASPAFADCTDPQTTVDMRRCAGEHYAEADAELNHAYRAARRYMHSLDSDLPKDLKGGADALLQAQRAWITYRDTTCFTEGFQFRGGSFEPIMVLTCKTYLTQRRSKDLRDLIEPN